MGKWVGSQINTPIGEYDESRKFLLDFASSWDKNLRKPIEIKSIKDLHELSKKYDGYPIIIWFNADEEYDEVTVYDYWIE